jgi:hypothetical protein
LFYNTATDRRYKIFEAAQSLFKHIQSGVEKSSQLYMERSKRERAIAGTGSISKSISAAATTGT